MKKLIMLLIIAILFTAGCSAKSKWNVTIEQEPVYQNDVLTIKVTENDEPVTGLSIVGIFDMTRMNHGETEVQFTERENGIYEAQLILPMPGEWTSTLNISNNETNQVELYEFNIETSVAHDYRSTHPDGIYATINGDVITEEEVEFYKFTNKLQIAYYREVDKERFEGEELENIMKFWDSQEIEANNVEKILDQIIRLKTMALIARDQGYEATKEEVDDDVNMIRERMITSGKIIENDPSKELIEQYGTDKFWNHQEAQSELTVLVNKVQEGIIENIRKNHPEATKEEFASLAQTEYENLLNSKRESLNIEMFVEKVQ